MDQAANPAEQLEGVEQLEGMEQLGAEEKKIPSNQNLPSSCRHLIPCLHTTCTTQAEVGGHRGPQGRQTRLEHRQEDSVMGTGSPLHSLEVRFQELRSCTMWEWPTISPTY